MSSRSHDAEAIYPAFLFFRRCWRPCYTFGHHTVGFGSQAHVKSGGQKNNWNRMWRWPKIDGRSRNSSSPEQHDKSTTVHDGNFVSVSYPCVSVTNCWLEEDAQGQWYHFTVLGYVCVYFQVIRRSCASSFGDRAASAHVLFYHRRFRRELLVDFFLKQKKETEKKRKKTP